METYLPMTPRTPKPVMNILLHSHLSSTELASSLRTIAGQIDPSAPVTKVRSLENVIVSSTAAPRALAGSALGIAGAVACTRLMSRFLFEASPLDPLKPRCRGRSDDRLAQ